jgi:hypothetical protein
MSFGVEKREDVPHDVVSMNEEQWKSKSVLERMKSCFREAGKIRSYSSENMSILAVGLYKAYQDKWGV